MNTAAIESQPPDGSGWYEVRLQGRLDPRWEATFEGMTLTTGHGATRLVGPVPDQAALHGLLRRLNDVGLPLVSVCRFEPSDTPHRPHHPDTASTPTP